MPHWKDSATNKMEHIIPSVFVYDENNCLLNYVEIGRPAFIKSQRNGDQLHLASLSRKPSSRARILSYNRNTNIKDLTNDALAPNDKKVQDVQGTPMCCSLIVVKTAIAHDIKSTKSENLS